jgi:hypothetical protein
MRFRWITSAFVVALFTVAVAGCDKAKKDDVDAAAAAVAAAAAAVDAATVAVAVTVAPDAGDQGSAGDAGVATLDASVKVAVPVRPAVAKPDPPICQAARSARHRNSPAAPSLEAQCKAAGGTM